MKIKAYDMTTDQHIELTASLTTDHPASIYGHAVMVIDEWDGDVMSHENWILAGCQVMDLPDDAAEVFGQWYSRIEGTAYHETGHAVTAYRFGHNMGKTSIIQESDRLGVSCAEGPWADGTRDIEYIITLYAGYEAQRKYNSNADIAGSSDDNETAAYYLQFHSGETETSLRQKAREMLSNDWHIIEAITSILMQEKELDGDDLGFIIDAIDEGGDWKAMLNEYRLRKQKLSTDH